MPDVSRHQFFEETEQKGDDAELKIDDFVEELIEENAVNCDEKQTELKEQIDPGSKTCEMNFEKTVKLHRQDVFDNVTEESRFKYSFLQSLNQKKHRQQGIQCNYSQCETIFTSKKTLAKHIKRHEGSICSMCAAKFTTTEKKKYHMIIKHAQEYQEDQVRRERLRVRLEIADLEEKQGRFKETRDIFTSLIKEYQGNVRLQKLFANFERRAGNYDESAKLMSGLSNERAEGNTKIKCDDCQKNFRSKYHFERHRLNSHSIAIQCKKCSVEFENRVKFRLHRAKCFWKCDKIRCSFKTRRPFDLK